MKRYAIVMMAGMAVLGVVGCHRDKAAAADSSKAAAGAVKTYKMRGKIVRTNAATGEAVIAHEAIAGFMEAMTMPYKLKDPSILGELHPGDMITADVLVSENYDVVIDHIVVIGQGKPDYKPAAVYHVPAAGDQVPDFKLTNEDGRKIHLGQFQGKAVLITFIYTSCPLPDFCPRVTKNFAEIEKDLAADPKLYAKTHLVSASFDTERDKPATLKKYGEGYMGALAPKAFGHWDFAVADKSTLKEMERFFDVGDTGLEKNGTITHTLSTTLIGPDGKVVAFYSGNGWTPQDVMADLGKIYAKGQA